MENRTHRTIRFAAGMPLWTSFLWVSGVVFSVCQSSGVSDCLTEWMIYT